VLFEPVPVSDDFSFEVAGEYHYGLAGPRSEDSYECSALLSPEGWRPVLDARPAIGPYVARRAGIQTTWMGVALADAEGKFPQGLAGSAPGLFMLVGHDQVGPTVASNLTVRPERGLIQKHETSRFWCLDGVSRFQAGDYLATDRSLEATGLSWSDSFAHGPLLRVRSNADLAGLHVDGPNGRHDAILKQGAGTDLTFCSPLPGPWRLTFDHASANGPWMLVATVFDASMPGLPCPGEWTASPVPAQ
jgi:hypothetical protein